MKLCDRVIVRPCGRFLSSTSDPLPMSSPTCPGSACIKCGDFAWDCPYWSYTFLESALIACDESFCVGAPTMEPTINLVNYSSKGEACNVTASGTPLCLPGLDCVGLLGSTTSQCVDCDETEFLTDCVFWDWQVLEAAQDFCDVKCVVTTDNSDYGNEGEFIYRDEMHAWNSEMWYENAIGCSNQVVDAASLPSFIISSGMTTIRAPGTPWTLRTGT